LDNKVFDITDARCNHEDNNVTSASVWDKANPKDNECREYGLA